MMPDLDRISFVVKLYRPGDRSGGIRIFINGEDLMDLVTVQERPYAEREGSPEIAGEYTGLPADRDTCPPSQHFLGNPAWDMYRYDDKIQVLVCECGEPGCWPLICRIEISDDRIVWSDFEQPHRTAPKSKRIWSYEGLGPFVFERSQYEAALKDLKRPE